MSTNAKIIKTVNFEISTLICSPHFYKACFFCSNTQEKIEKVHTFYFLQLQLFAETNYFSRPCKNSHSTSDIITQAFLSKNRPISSLLMKIIFHNRTTPCSRYQIHRSSLGRIVFLRPQLHLRLRV